MKKTLSAILIAFLFALCSSFFGELVTGKQMLIFSLKGQKLKSIFEGKSSNSKGFPRTDSHFLEVNWRPVNSVTGRGRFECQLCRQCRNYLGPPPPTIGGCACCIDECGWHGGIPAYTDDYTQGITNCNGCGCGFWTEECDCDFGW